LVAQEHGALVAVDGGGHRNVSRLALIVNRDLGKLAAALAL
jgi:hypothetical protein